MQLFMDSAEFGNDDDDRSLKSLFRQTLCECSFGLEPDQCFEIQNESPSPTTSPTTEPTYDPTKDPTTG